MAKIAIITNLMEFNPGYSLTGIIADQARMFALHGDEVTVFVNEQFDRKTVLFKDDKFSLYPVIPFTHLIDYASQRDLTAEHKNIAFKTKEICEDFLPDYDYVFTHDLVFLGWFVPYALGIHAAAEKLRRIPFLHWIHSVPSGLKDWWYIRAYGHNHKLVFPNEAQRLHVAEQYRGEIEDVRVIHHIKDLRSFYDFAPKTATIIDQLPGLLNADIVQLLPIGADRLQAKGLDQVIKIFGHLKALGKSVCLLVANQWATTLRHKENEGPFEEQAEKCGLTVGKEFVFTSTLAPEYEKGIPKRMIRELFQCSNLFIFPTREESFGLVVPEAALAGGVLPVLNKSLEQQVEISGGNALYFEFNSFNRFNPATENDNYYRDIARIIVGRMRENESIKAKTFMRQRYNFDALYEGEYAPILAEAKLWAGD